MTPLSIRFLRPFTYNSFETLNIYQLKSTIMKKSVYLILVFTVSLVSSFSQTKKDDKHPAPKTNSSLHGQDINTQIQGAIHNNQVTTAISEFPSQLQRVELPQGTEING